MGHIGTLGAMITMAPCCVHSCRRPQAAHAVIPMILNSRGGSLHSTSAKVNR